MEKGWRTFTVNPAERTITDEWGTYQYEISGKASDYDITITYPNGRVYHYNNSGAIRWSDGPNKFDYTPGSFLCDALKDEIPPDPFDDTVLGLVLMAIGAFYVMTPKAAWFLELGWRYKGTAPSDWTLLLHSIGGGFAIIIGLIMVILP